VLTDGRFEMGIGTGRPGIEEELRELGMPVVPPGERLAQVRETVTALRDLDGPDLHTPVVMAVRGPKAQALAVEVADAVTFAVLSSATRAEVAGLARDFRAVRDVELALHVPVIGDTVAPFMASVRDTDPAALREADSLAILPDDPAAAADEIQRRRGGDRLLLLRLRCRLRRGVRPGRSRVGRTVAHAAPGRSSLPVSYRRDPPVPPLVALSRREGQMPAYRRAVRMPRRACGEHGWGSAAMSPHEAIMATTTLLALQPDAMSPAQLAAVSYLARYCGSTHRL
jgi:hypothetical protein